MTRASLWLLSSLSLFLLDKCLEPIIGMETDFWWHLAAGKRMWEGHWDGVDPYSFTCEGKRWIHVDWLFQLLIYPIYKLGGLGAILLGRYCLLIVAVGLLFRALQRAGVTREITWLVTAGAISVWGSGIALRPATFSILFTTLLFCGLEEVRRGHTGWRKFLPLVIVIWFNFHIAALAGIALVGLYALGEALSHKKVPTPGLLICCGLAPFFNPQGWRTVYLPVEMQLNKTPWTEFILELQPPAWDWPGTLLVRLFLAAALIEALLRLRHRDYTTFLVVTVLGALCLSSYRHQFQFCSVLAYFAAALVGRSRAVVRWAFVPVAVLSVLVSLRALLALAFLWPPQELLRRESFAETVVETIRSGPVGLRVFTDMNSAGYYMWRTEGRQKVWIDSRATQVYNDNNFVAAYFEVLLGGEQCLKVLRQTNVDVVAQNRLTSGGSPLYDRLEKSPDWVLHYADMAGAVYCRRALQSRLPKLEPPAYLRLFVLGCEAQSRTDIPLARSLFRAALDDYPQFASVHQHLAQLDLIEGQIGQARRHLARAELYNPATPLAAEWTLALGSVPPGLRHWLLPFLCL